MNTVPKSQRLTLALVGRTNVGKSTLLNLIAGQDVAITSPIAGTTTDVVEKAMELLPFGPILLLDTAGFDDSTVLGSERVKKTRKALERADIVIAVSDAETDPELSAYSGALGKPVLFINTRRFSPDDRETFLNFFIPALLPMVPAEFVQPPPLFSDIVPKHATIFQIVPIDSQAPKGRIILPQMNVLREALDNDFVSVVTTEKNIPQTLAGLTNPPHLTVCDSQVVHIMCRDVPEPLPVTTYSIIMARCKGDLATFIAGAKAIDSLKDGDKILIAESCTHHAGDEDIGRVKIPKWIQKRTGKQLVFECVAGRDFPETLAGYALVIQCGGCMTNRAQILSRIATARAAGIPITNYGVCISFLQDVLDRVIRPFGNQGI